MCSNPSGHKVRTNAYIEVFSSTTNMMRSNYVFKVYTPDILIFKVYRKYVTVRYPYTLVYVLVYMCLSSRNMITSVSDLKLQVYEALSY